MKLFTHPKYTNLYFRVNAYFGYHGHETSGFRISEDGFRFRLAADTSGVKYL